MNNLEKKPFVKYDLSENKSDKDIIKSLRLSPDNQLMLAKNMRILQQPKLSSIIKELMYLGDHLLHGTSEGVIFKVINTQRNRNKRLGIAEVE